MEAQLAQLAAIRFVRFALVGGTGFLVDAGTLALFHHSIGLDPYLSRALSMLLAIFATWRLNRRLTFGASCASQAAEGLRYGLVAALTAGLNYSLYALTLLLWRDLAPVTAAAAATVLTMFASYTGYSRLVFADAGLSRSG
jgi:putative flippase GtrA